MKEKEVEREHDGESVRTNERMRNTQLKEKKQVSQSEGLKGWKKEVARQHRSESEVDIENEKTIKIKVI